MRNVNICITCARVCRFGKDAIVVLNGFNVALFDGNSSVISIFFLNIIYFNFFLVISIIDYLYNRMNRLIFVLKLCQMYMKTILLAKINIYIIPNARTHIDNSRDPHNKRNKKIHNKIFNTHVQVLFFSFNVNTATLEYSMLPFKRVPLTFYQEKLLSFTQ